MRSSARERMLCTFCQARIPIKPFCSECGNPTAYASREERIQYELEKWGRAQAPTPDRIIDLAALEKAEEPPAPRRRPEPGRKAPRAVRHAEAWPDVTGAPEAAAAPGARTLHSSARKEDRWRRALALLPDETVAFAKEGRCGPERATLIITRYRVAVVQGSKARWIPLENIDRLDLVEGKTCRLIVCGSIETLAFRHPDRKLLEAILTVLKHEATLGNLPGGLRHHPDVMQEWVESLTDTWKSAFRPVRVWVHRHPGAAAVLH